MAKSKIDKVEKKAVEISVEAPKNPDKDHLDPEMAHAIFLSGKTDKKGEEMNKMALISIEAMKLVKNQGKIFFRGCAF